MSANRWIRRGLAVALTAATVGLVPTAAPSVGASDGCTEGGLCAGGEFFAVSPDRVLDTNEPTLDVAPLGRKALPGAFDVPVLGTAGVPTENVLAVAVNVTIVGAPGRGYATLRPSDFTPGADDDLTSLINFEAGDTVPNFGIVGVGTEGAITIDMFSETPGDARVTVDVFGWVASSSFQGGDGLPDPAVGARMITQTPQRVLDTRPDQEPAGDALDRAVGPFESVEIPIRGRAGVPDSSNVTGVVLNLAGINTADGNTLTYLSLSPDRIPDGQPEADVASGNYAPNQIKSNFAIVPLNDAGSLWMFNRDGNIHVTLDVVGYLEGGYGEATLQGRIVPLEAPFRSFDTRETEFDNTKLGFSSWEDWSYQAFAESVKLNDQPVGPQSGLLGNLSAFAYEPRFPAGPDRTFMTLNPTDPRPISTPGHGQGDAPGNANLNLKGDEGAVNNMSLVTYGSNGDGDDNMVSAYNAEGSVHYILDVYAVILAD